MEEAPDQRHRRRRPLLVEVQVRDADEVYLYSARNLSGGGMFIDTPVPLPPGTPLQLEFKLPGGAAVRTDAEVRWTTDTIAARPARVKHPGMGVVFRGVGSDAIRRILTWVEGSA